jgi:soluble lytic murein transglycosylase-like protein
MSSELDTFVLKYQANVNDAVNSLQRLQKEMASTSKDSEKSTSKFGELKQALSELHPSLGKSITLMGDMGRVAGVAALGVGGLAVVYRSVTAAMKDYNAQMTLARQSGMGTVAIEGITRNLSAASGGMVTRGMSRAAIGSISDTLMDAYSDPTRMNDSNRRLRLLGVRPSGPDGQIAGTQDVLNQLGARWAKESKERAEAEGMFLHIAPQATDAIRALGGRVGDLSNMSTEAAKRTEAATAASQTLQAALSGIHEDFKKVGNVLTDELMPPVAAFFKLLKDGADGTAKAVGATADWIDNAREGHGSGFLDHVQRFLNLRESDNASGVKSSVSDEWKKSASDKKDESAKDIAAQQSAGMKDLRDSSANLQLAANLLNGAAQAFSSTPSTGQMLAAWAGNIGNAARLPGSSSSPVSSSAAALISKTAYDPMYEAAAKATGMDANLLKRITQVESHFDPNAKSEKGALGLMQLMPSNLKSLGVKNALDPAQNIMGGAKLFKQYLGMAGGDVRTALMMYHGGLDRSGWGPKTQAYPELVLGAPNSGIGESRETMQFRSVQENIANRLHVPLMQVQRGGVTKGDADWARSQAEAGVQNQIFSLKRQLMNPILPAQTRGKLEFDLRDQQRGLSLLQHYGPGVVAQQADGGRERTIGERPIVININGVTDPKAVAEEVNKQLTKSMHDVVNHFSTGVKG